LFSSRKILSVHYFKYTGIDTNNARFSEMSALKYGWFYGSLK